MTAVVFVNGAFLPRDRASVSVFDGGLLHGAGLFETMRAEHGRVFRLDRHLNRIQQSAARLLAPLAQGTLPNAETLSEMLTRNGLSSARIRLTVTAGSMREEEAVQPVPTVLATASALSGYPPSFYEQGVTVMICPFRQSPTDPLAGHKTTSYLPRLLGLREAQQARCMEAIWFTTSKHLAEGSISNVFLVRDGVLKTPPLDAPVLPGIARGVVLEIARAIGMPCEETPLGIDDLLDANEVFLTNSIMQVMPVIRVEKRDIGPARVGEITGRILQEYRRMVEKECTSP